jgi:hypothetical protein
MRKGCLQLVLWMCVAGWVVADTGWMRGGMRAWYIGGVGGGGTASDAEEAYLLGAVSGTQAPVTHHSATGHWGMPLPVQESVHDLADQGPFWIHPAVLAQLAPGPTTFWQGMEVTLVIRTECTYGTLPCGALLPAVNLFEAAATREIVTVNYMMPGHSVGSAYFDAATGLLLQRHALWGYSKIFLLLAEINYDFVTRTAFPEPDRPHPGFKSMVALTSFDGGMIVAHALVESAQGEAVEMRVRIDETGAGPFGESRTADLNACFFGDGPVLRVIDATEAEGVHPAAWDPLGEYTWWWIPPAALERDQIQVFGGVMERTAKDPGGAEFSATNEPDGLHLRWAAFDAAGYVTGLWMADPTIGMSVGPHNAFNATITVDGLDYYRQQMGAAVPGPAVFPGDGFWRDALDLGGGWRWLDWLGYFNVHQAPRIFHLEHGWLYARGDSPASITFYDPEMGAFWWTRDTVYPYLYRFGANQWLYYQRGSANPRSFLSAPAAP